MALVDCEIVNPLEIEENRVFNHNFMFTNASGNFPAGWQICHGTRTADFTRQKDDKQGFSIRIRNKTHYLASICQQRSYSVPVYEKQVWEIGAILKTEQVFPARIKIHFITNSARVLYLSLDFLLKPEDNYYYGLATVPAGADYAYIEVGTTDVGTLWIEDIVFKKVFPVEKYNTDSQGRLNINTVAAIKKITDPVNVTGNLDLKKKTRDVVEDVVAGPILMTSTIQDVIYFSTYSFCVINQGNECALVRIQLSPDGINFWEEPTADDRLEAGHIKILSSNYFLRYLRLNYQTESTIPTNLRIFFQAQG